MLSLDDLLSARQAIAGKVRLTPVLDLPAHHSKIDARVVLKAESLQITGSFKARGALNRVRFLSEAEKRRGLITASAGNHALALAWAAKQVGAACTVVMPQLASMARFLEVESLGTTVIVQPTMPLVFATMEQVRTERQLTLVHPFDDPLVIAGQGTLGLEIVEQVPDMTKVIVGVGGGGLIAGIALAIKHLRPQVQVFGVEPEGAAAMNHSWEAGHAVRLDKVETIADGLGAPYVSDLTYDLTRRYVDGMVTVTDAEIAEALRWLINESRLVIEPAGAAATAALLCGKIPVQPEEVVVTLASGSNIDLSRFKTFLPTK